MQKAKLIRVDIKHVETLFITDSPDIRGLIISARTEEEVITRAPFAIKEMLDFGGGNWIVTECENPEAIGAQYAFAAIPSEEIQ